MRAPDRARPEASARGEHREGAARGLGGARLVALEQVIDRGEGGGVDVVARGLLVALGALLRRERRGERALRLAARS